MERRSEFSLNFAFGSEMKKAYLNNRSKGRINASSTWNSPVLFMDAYADTGARMGDVNGDGFGDILVAHMNSSVGYQYTWTKNSTVPYLLKAITNEYDRKVNVTYADSTSFNNNENDSL